MAGSLRRKVSRYVSGDLLTQPVARPNYRWGYCRDGLVRNIRSPRGVFGSRQAILRRRVRRGYSHLACRGST